MTLRLLAQALLIAALAWGAFAFGAVYPWAYWPLLVATTVVSGVGLGLHDSSKSLRLSGLTAAFALFLAAGLVQLVPLPLSILSVITPAGARILPNLNLAVAAGDIRTHSLSIVPSQTLTGLILFTANALLILGGARLLSVVGARRIAEGLTCVGAALAISAIIQNRLFTGKIYGFWTPLEGENAFGPFVNRNHFAGWMLMALPVTFGLICGRITALRIGRSWRDRLLWLGSGEAGQLILLASAGTVMALSLVLTTSRSGMVALGLALVLATGFVGRHLRAGQRLIAAGYLAVLVVIAVGWVGSETIAQHFEQTDWHELNDRRGAWEDAIRVAVDSPVTGTGLNTYDVAMLVYQRYEPSKYFAEAHNDYLQLAAEGGLLLGIPAALCLGLFVISVLRRFHEGERDRTYWLRVGGVIGLAAIALQEAVDFSLQIPGNALLFAVLCAITLHRDPVGRRQSGSSTRLTSRP